MFFQDTMIVCNEALLYLKFQKFKNSGQEMNYLSAKNPDVLYDKFLFLQSYGKVRNRITEIV